ncbi:MAG: helix-turn-helix domain-containing protein [bacterium]
MADTDTRSISPDLLRIADIAVKTRISERTLWRLIAAGKFPGPDLSIGRIRRWKTQTIDSWIAGEWEE